MSAVISSLSLLFLFFMIGCEPIGCTPGAPTLSFSNQQVIFDSGKTGSVEIRINNNDRGCNPATFRLLTSHSSSVIGRLSSSEVTINSASSELVSLTLSSSTAGNYPVKINVSGKDVEISETVNLTVKSVVTPTPTPTPTPNPAPAPVELTVYTDGTDRLNKLLKASLNVTIPAGIYMITKELDVRDGHVIQAAKDAQVILKVADTYKEQIMSLYQMKVTVRGLTFDGNYSKRKSLEANQYASLVMIHGGSSLTFENNKFQFGPSYGIWSYRSSLLQIRGNTFNEVYHAIRIDGGDLESGVISNNTFKNTAAFKSYQHIDAIWTKNLVINGNTFEGAGLAEPTNHGILGTWGNSIFIHNSKGHIVEKNKVYKNSWSALVSGTNAAHGIIRNNYFMGWGSTTAVWMEQPGADYLTFENNELDGGISIGDNGGNHITIRKNIIRAKDTAIDVTFGAKDILIEDNQIISANTARSNMGIYLFEKSTPDVNVRINNNSFKGFSTGISINNYMGQGTVYGIKLKGNTFVDNKTNIWINPSLKLDQPLGQ